MMHVYCSKEDSLVLYRPDDFDDFKRYLESLNITSTFIAFLRYAFEQCKVDFLMLDNAGSVVPGFDTFDW
jgi:hypothetical protein